MNRSPVWQEMFISSHDPWDKSTWTTCCPHHHHHRQSLACNKEKRAMWKVSHTFSQTILTTTVKSKSKTISRYRKHKADISAQSVTLPWTDTYAALLLFVPFGTTAPPPAWVPLAPIPRFGSGNSINNTERCNVAQMTGDFLLCLEH